MKNKLMMLMTAAMVTLGTAAPSFADGPVHEATGLVGVTTATVVDVPEGLVIDSVYSCPKKSWHGLASAFGDEHGLLQNITGAVIGVPTGMVFGVPYGAIHGLYHAYNNGWDKPFGMESYIVTDEK